MKNIETYKRWLNFISGVRKLMISDGYKEVMTQTLVESPAMEAYLDGFKIENETLYLPTSPEFGLKKVWLSGDSEFKKIFEISRSFRANEDQSPFHLAEFTMLEFYQNDLKFTEFIEDVFKICKSILDLPKSFEASVVSLPEFFCALTGIDLKSDFSECEMKSVCERLKVKTSKGDSLNDLFQRLYLEVIEPSMSKKDFIILKDFPPFLSALAKISTKGWAERFEFYFDGLELANGYNELLDHYAVKERWSKENQIRSSLGLKVHPVDYNLLSSLKNETINQGVGVALGLERLFYLKEKLQGRAVTLDETQVV